MTERIKNDEENSLEEELGHSLEERHLEFSLGKEQYAIPLLKVREVIAVPKTTPIPHTPNHFVGIMNLRGQVISVIDTRKKLGIPVSENKESEIAVIIVDLSPIFLGVIVDSVNKVLSLAPSDVSPPPAMDGKNLKYITGVYRTEERMTIMMDIGKALDINDLQIAEANQKVA